MANTIRIKRRAAGGAAGAPASLANAELAFNEQDNVLYYGKGTGGSGGSATTVEVVGGLGAFVSIGTTQTVTGNKTFSGTTIVPTMLSSDNSTSAATTAYVKSQSYGSVTSVAALVINATGTDITSTVASGTTTPTITLNIPTASASNRGALSSADWTTFNSKQAAGAVTAVTATAPVASSGGTTPVISMAAATTSVSGYLTATDWTTFNGKQAAGSYATGGGTATGTNTGDNAVNTLYSSLVTNATHTGDATGATALTLATVNSNIGTYNNVTINAKGLATAGSNVAYLTAEADTLATVTARGATTAVASTFSGGIAMGNSKVTGLATPTADTDAATKLYVDSTSQGLAVKDAVRVATTANITLSAPQTVDGVVLVAGDRVLVKDQTTGSQNGLYLVAAAAWTRTIDADAPNELSGGDFVFVQEGTTQADSGWVCTNDGAVTIGTTALTFTQFSGAGQVIAGTGLTKTGNTLNISTVPVANGGTGATTAAGALTNLGAYAAANPSGYTNNLGTVTSVTGTAPVVSSGGTTPAISMAAATTSVSGYLTSTDWTTFNAKQPAGAYLTASTGVTTFAGGTTGLLPASATSGAVTLTGTLVVANGGTGATTLTGILKGNGTGAFTAATDGTDYLSSTAAIDGGVF